MANITKLRGATTVIGFDSEIGCSVAHEWTIAFFDAFEDGNSAEVACAIADSAVAGHPDAYTIVGHSYIVPDNIDELLEGK